MPARIGQGPRSLNPASTAARIPRRAARPVRPYDGDVLDRALAEVDRTDNRIERHAGHGIPHRGSVAGIAGIAHCGQPDFEQGMAVAKCLRPLRAAGGLPFGGKLRGALPGQGRDVGKARGPPDLGAHALAASAQSIERAWEQERGHHGRGLGSETGLGGLVPERRPMGREAEAGDDVRPGVLERRHLDRKIVGL